MSNSQRFVEWNDRKVEVYGRPEKHSEPSHIVKIYAIFTQ